MYRHEIKEKVWVLPASDLLFVGKSTEKKLARIGIHTIGDIARADEHFLHSHLGTGNDRRSVDSLLISLSHYAEANKKPVNVNLFGKSIGVMIPNQSHFFAISEYDDIENQLNKLQNMECVEGITVNLFIEPNSYEEYVQSPGGIRKSLGADLLKRVLASERGMFSVIYTRNFRNLRSSLQYAIQECPIRFATVGDAENIRMTTSENVYVGLGDFDIPKKDAIKAYYYNKDTEKYGKVIMYCA